MERPEKPATLYLLEELELYGAMPCEGGYLDQPYTLMMDLRIARVARQQWRNSQLKAEDDDLASKIAAARQRALGLAGQGGSK